MGRKTGTSFCCGWCAYNNEKIVKENREEMLMKNFNNETIGKEFEAFLSAMREQVNVAKEKNLKEAKKLGEKFYTGNICIMPGVRALGLTMDSPELDEIFKRFMNCDWGDTPKEDEAINETSIKSGYGDIMGSYIVNGVKIWIKTDLCEGTRTTIMLPSEW